MATLSLTISEEITINGGQKSTSNTLDITGVTQLDQRIVKVGTSEQSLVLFDSAEAAGQFADSNVKYLRITNTDTSNHVTLRMTAGDDEYFVKVSAGNTFLLFDTVMDADSNTTVATASLANIDSIKAQANTAACNLELFIASS